MFSVLSNARINYKRINYIKYSRISQNGTLELIWSILPALILFAIAVPSFVLLYSMDESHEVEWTYKIIGHQWYWSYEMSDSFVYQYNLSIDDIFSDWMGFFIMIVIS